MRMVDLALIHRILCRRGFNEWVLLQLGGRAL